MNSQELIEASESGNIELVKEILANINIDVNSKDISIQNIHDI